MTNIKFLLIGTSLSLIPSLTFAQCVATQDCKTLGYTETSCNGGKGVKCPFGNSWACLTSDSEIEQQFCDKYSFKYTCSGTGYSGGGGSACSGKYSYCTCASGYEWKSGACRLKEANYASCTIGSLYYSDGSCSQNKLSNKTLLGVVIYEKNGSQNGWIMTTKPLGLEICWSNERGGSTSDYDNIPNLTDYSSTPTDTQKSCTNTDIITAFGNSERYPAAWAAKNYKPTGTPSGTSWCLPSAGLLQNLTSAANIARVNAGITVANGIRLGETDSDMENIWSSSEKSTRYVWDITFYGYSADFEFQKKLGSTNKDHCSDRCVVRPVMPF